MLYFVLLHIFKTETYFHQKKAVCCMLKLFLLKQKLNRTILFHSRRCVNWIHWKPHNQVTLALTSYHVSAEHLCELLAHGICAITVITMPCTCHSWSVHAVLLLCCCAVTRVYDYLVTSVQVSLAAGRIRWQVPQLMGFSFLCVQFAWKGPTVGNIEYCAQL